MRPLVFGAMMLFLLQASATGAHAQPWAWAKCSRQCFDPSHALVEGGAMTADYYGNVYCTGTQSGICITFGTDTYVNTTTFGTDMLFVVKYDSSGNYKWSRSAGTATRGKTNGIAADDSGNVYWAGDFYAPSATFGAITLTVVSGTAGFLVKYDSMGNVLWAKKVNGNAAHSSVALSADGGVYLAGSFYDVVANTDTFLLHNTGASDDMFLIRYTHGGSVVWAKTEGSGGYSDIATGVSCDGAGNVYVSGTYTSPSLTFGASTISNAAPSGANVFVAKFNSSGAAQWVKSIDHVGSGGFLPGDTRADAAGNVYITGAFGYDSIVLSGYRYANSASPQFDGYVAKYNSSGVLQWAHHLTGNGYQMGEGLAVDVAGRLWVAVAAMFTDTMLVDTTRVAMPSGNDGAAELEFDGAGNLVSHWAQSFGGDDYIGIATDHGGNIFVGADYAGGPLSVGPDVLTNEGLENFFVAKIARHVDISKVSVARQQDEPATGLYPNPADAGFTVSTAASPDGLSYVAVYNGVGQRVLTAPVVSQLTNIATRELPAGLYVVRVVAGGEVVVRRLVVAH